MKIEHGTRRGFQQHKAVGGMVCPACQSANNAYMATYMREHYSPAQRRARYLRSKERAA